MTLRKLRHPRLLLQRTPVVANDVLLTAQQRALVISGPNAGGKTVTLTAVGLCVLMMRAGLPIPVEANAQLPMYRGVCTAIGDAQDLARGLSTFSAHLHHLKNILDMAQDGWLVLIDEIAADTDPVEGAALARATLETLVEQRARVLATTHLEEVKALGVVDPRFANARVGFDAVSLQPTFVLELGVAGVSNALVVAAQVGLPKSVLERAQSHLSGTGLLSAALAILADTQQQAKIHADTAAADRQQAAAQRQEASRLHDEATAARRRARAEAQAAWAAELESKRKEVGAVMAALQAAPTIRRAQEVQANLAQQIGNAKKDVQHDAVLQETPEARPATKVVPGTRVKIISLGNEGEVLSVDGDMAVVAVGLMRSRIKLTELIPLQARSKPRSTPFPGTQKKAPEAVAAGALPGTAGQCDVRGMRADEALRQLDRALDHSYSHGAQRLIVVHGHGTGALKEAVREALENSPYVADFRPGARQEGGEGVTVVELCS